MKKVIFIVLILLIVLSITAYAHPGSLDSNGGHWNHQTGEYHYHDGDSGVYRSGSSSGNNDRSYYKSQKSASQESYFLIKLKKYDWSVYDVISLINSFLSCLLCFRFYLLKKVNGKFVFKEERDYEYFQEELIAVLTFIIFSLSTFALSLSTPLESNLLLLAFTSAFQYALILICAYFCPLILLMLLAIFGGPIAYLMDIISDKLKK